MKSLNMARRYRPWALRMPGRQAWIGGGKDLEVFADRRSRQAAKPSRLEIISLQLLPPLGEHWLRLQFRIELGIGLQNEAVDDPLCHGARADDLDLLRRRFGCHPAEG